MIVARPNDFVSRAVIRYSFVISSYSRFACLMNARPLTAILAAAPPAPTSLTDEHLSRITHRVHGCNAVHRSAEYAMIVAHFPAEMLPEEPDPYDVGKYSKRVWEKTMKEWRVELRRLQQILQSSSAASSA